MMIPGVVQKYMDQERTGVQLLAHAFRLQRVFAHIERLEHVQRASHQFIVRESRSPPGDTVIREHCDESMNAVLRPNLVRPASLGGAMA